MSWPGSYQWWRENYATDPGFQAVCTVLTSNGVDCSQVEVDHFPPNASYTGSAYDTMLPYGARPAFPLPKYVHRFHSGGGGMGGHASTTGSTFVSAVWTGEVRNMMQAGNFYGAMKYDIIDKKNLALFYTNGQNRNLFNGVLRPAVDLARSVALIDDAQYYDLLNDLGAWG
jgi:hypothetical protein